MLIFASSLHFSIYAQTTSESAVVGKSKGFQELKLDSKLMKREMPYRVILPVGYEVNTSEKFPVIYLLHGLTGHFNNWTDKSKIVEYAKNYNYIIVTPEGDNGWYSDSATVENDKYESYIIQELIPEIEKKFRAQTNRESRAIAGLSMGGYGAMKFGLKYPEKFRSRSVRSAARWASFRIAGKSDEIGWNFRRSNRFSARTTAKRENKTMSSGWCSKMPADEIRQSAVFLFRLRNGRFSVSKQPRFCRSAYRKENSARIPRTSGRT